MIKHPNLFAVIVVAGALSIYGMTVGPGNWVYFGAVTLGISFRFGYFFATEK